MSTQRIIPGDCIEAMRTLPDASVHCCVTSPPYWGLRDYGHDGQIGLEATPEAYVARMVEVFREVRRVLRDDGTCWLNLGDSYAAQRSGTAMPAETLAGGLEGQVVDGRGSRGRGDVEPDAVAGRARRATGTGPKHRDAAAIGLKHKDLCGIPWRVAFALQADGWWLRQDIIWHKPNPMPESVRDRCTKAHEYVFLMTKSERYFYDAEAVSEAASQSSGWAKQRNNGVNTWKYNAKPERVAATGQRASDTQGFGLEGRRNRRSVWTVTTKPYSGAHFAVMPAALVEPCIKAGCPDQCCPVCGKGWERVVERTNEDYGQQFPNFRRAAELIDEKGFSREELRSLGASGWRKWKSDGAVPGFSESQRRLCERIDSDLGGYAECAIGVAVGKKATTGWQPACDCAASGTIPGTVLDPFAGSGTTLAVAAELGRSGIGCELNPEYIALAERRIKDARSSVALFEGIPA